MSKCHAPFPIISMVRSAVHILVCMVLLGFCSCSQEQKAERLFRQATAFVESGQRAEGESHSRALKEYEAALAKAEAILSRYPSSQVAIGMCRGELKVGGYTTAEFRNVVVPESRLRVDAQEDPLACALVVTRAIKPAYKGHTTLVEIADIYAEAGQFNEALRTAEYIGPGVHKFKALAQTADRYTEAGQPETAKEILTEALQKAKQIGSGRALVRIADSYARLEDDHRASQILNDALELTKSKDEGPRYMTPFESMAIAEIAGKYSEIGDGVRALEILDEAFELATTTRSTSDRVIAWTRIADEYAKAGGKERAGEILHEAFELARTIESDFRREQILRDIACRFSALEQEDKALQAVRAMKWGVFKGTARATIAQQQAEAGLYGKALHTVSCLGHYLPVEEAQVRASVALGYWETGREDEAIRIARSIKRDAERAKVIAEIAGRYLGSGQKSRALELLSEALETAKTLGDPREKTEALTQIAAQHGAAGEHYRASEILLEALALTRAIEPLHQKARALHNIGEAYMRARQKPDRKARGILRQIVRDLG